MKSLRNWLLSHLLPGTVGLLTFLFLWQGVIWILRPPAYLLPSPSAVLEVIREQAGVLVTAVYLTASAALGGLLASLLVGGFLAVVFSQSLFLERGFYPYAVFLQTVPIVAISPILILLSGHGFHTIVLISCIVSVFPILANGSVGLRAVHPSLVDLFRLHRASRWQELWKLRLPNAIPYFIMGVRTASGLAILGAIVGESFTQYANDEAGLGYLTVVTFRQQQTALLYAVALISSLLGVVIFGLIGVLEQVFFRKWALASAASE